MAPPCVLLEREVIFAPAEPQARTGGIIGGSAGGANDDDEAPPAATGGGPTIQPRSMPMMKDILEAMKPELVVSDPPEISCLRMVRHVMGGPPGGMISSTDEALVLLYAGFYQPGFSTSPSSGCYLVYDASADSLTAIPQLPGGKGTFRALGRGAAILSRGEGGRYYEVAELVAGKYGFPDAALFLWRQCPNSNLTGDDDGKWIRKAVRLPPQVFVPGYSFKIDMAFSYAGSSICWVDLLKGIVICNMVVESAADQPEFTFVPLPEGYSLDIPPGEPRPRPKEFRTMGCANGGSVIKFVAVAGYDDEACNINDLVLRTWTLTPDLKNWEEGTTLPVRDLWASESFRARSLPQLAPSHPVISTNEEEEVVCVILNEFDRVHGYDNYGEDFVEIVRKAQHVLRLDMVQKKVLQSTKIIPDDMTPVFTDLIASEFAVYLQGSN